MKFKVPGILLISISMTSFTYADSAWVPVTGEQTLRLYMSSLKAERQLPNGEMSRGEYLPDGTGVLYAWGAEKPRTWRIEGDNQVCISAARDTVCYTLERNKADAQLYRATDIKTGNRAEFRVTDGRSMVLADPKAIGNEGGAAAPSADEIAAELSNPNTAVASLTFKNQFRWFDGGLQGASEQQSYTMLFQPSLPFVLNSGDKVIWRPAVPLLVGQPQYDSVSGDFETRSGLGDIAFDLAYAPKRDDNLLLGYGVFSSLPTATNDLGTKRVTLGPEVLIGTLAPDYVLGMLANHQWDIAGSGNADINLTTISAFYTYLPGGGWSVGTAPIMNYNWEAEQWTIPLNLTAGKTVTYGGRPWKLSAEINYYVDRPDAFGPEWMIGLNVAPVVKNGLSSWFGL